MVKSNLFTTALSALLHLSRSYGGYTLPFLSMAPSHYQRPNKSRRVRIGRKYPFSSTRQNERFRRQFEAGKIKFA